jgi:acyl-homoserine-lactone acylase
LQYPYKIDSMLLLNAADYPQYATLINNFKEWDHNGGADSKGAAIFLLTYEYLKNLLQGQPSRQITLAEALQTYKHVHGYMQTNFGRSDIVLGDVQKLVRGNKDWPLGGLPDVLAAQWTGDYKEGKLKSVGGDGLVMFVRFPKQGLPIIETLNMYGVSAKPGNKHFDDQVEMYLHQQTKKMTLDKAAVYKNAESITHPL